MTTPTPDPNIITVSYAIPVSQEVMEDSALPPFVWAVVFSNYEPAEVAEIYDSEDAARRHADILGDSWHAERWPVRSMCNLLTDAAEIRREHSDGDS